MDGKAEPVALGSEDMDVVLAPFGTSTEFIYYIEPRARKPLSMLYVTVNSPT